MLLTEIPQTSPPEVEVRTHTVPIPRRRRTRGLRRRRCGRGFTFLEIIVVVAILAILATLIIPRFTGRVEDARVTQCNVQMKEIQKTLEMYRLDNSRYPTSEQGLKALVEKPSSDPLPTHWKKYIDEVPKDPWGNDFVYVSPGTKGAWDLVSLGPDGKQGDNNLRLSEQSGTPSPGATP